MVKRIFCTCIIFFFATLGIFMLLSEIGFLTPIILEEAIFNAVGGVLLYLILLRIYAKGYHATIRTLFIVILGIGIVMIFLEEEGMLSIQLLKSNLELLIYALFGILQAKVAKRQIEEYREEEFWEIEDMMEEKGK